MRLLELIDTWGHRLRLPDFIFRPFCDAYDRALGVPAPGESTIVDRFICRREGHKPAAWITGASGVTIDYWITTCQRCGKAITVDASTGRPPSFGAEPRQDTKQR